MKYYVYLLCYPDETPFYVGKGSKNSHGDRIHHHEAEARGAKPLTNPFKVRVIQKIWREGGEVVRKKIAFFEEEQGALDFERGTIHSLREQGIRLTNLTDGGEGVSGFRFSPESIERMSASHMGKHLKEDHRSKLLHSRKGKHNSEEHNKHISASNKGRIPPTAKVWVGFVSPDGEVYRDVFSLLDFCNKHGLTQQHMYAVAHGTRKSHKGWVLLKE